MASTTLTGWPDATNTGVPPGVQLTASGDVVITKAGTTVSGLDIHGTVYINAPDVTLMNCKVTAPAFAVVKIASGVTGAVVQNCEINGVGTGNDGSAGILGQGTFIKNNIYNVENGIALNGNNSVIQDNYIHDLQASGAPHYDGIQIDGGLSNEKISHNTIINSHNQTAAVMIDNYYGPISNVSVDNNLLVGGGYTIYSDAQFGGGPISGVSITNNHIGGGGFGPTDFNKNSPTYTGNVLDGTTLAQSLNSHSAGASPSQPADPTPPAAPDQPAGTGSDGSTGSHSSSGSTGSQPSDPSQPSNPSQPSDPTQPSNSNHSGHTQDPGHTQSSGHAHNSGHTHTSGQSQSSGQTTGSVSASDPTQKSGHNHHHSSQNNADHSHVQISGHNHASKASDLTSSSGSGHASNQGSGGHHSAVSDAHQHSTYKCSAGSSDHAKAGVDTIKAAVNGAWSLAHASGSNGSAESHHGGHGASTIGSAGNDTLTSTASNDVLSGNGGHDTFVFAPHFGKDTITDFHAKGSGHDVVQFNGSALDSFADVLAHASQSAHGVLIAAGHGDSLTLKNAKVADLHGSDFHFG